MLPPGILINRGARIVGVAAGTSKILVFGVEVCRERAVSQASRDSERRSKRHTSRRRILQIGNLLREGHARALLRGRHVALLCFLDG